MESNGKNSPKIVCGNISRIILGLSEIGNLEIDDFKINYGITRSIAALTEAEKAYNKTLSALQKRLIKKNERGVLAIENGYYVFETTKDQEEYEKESTSLQEKDAEAKVFTMKASDLQKIKGIRATAMAKCHELIIFDLEEDGSLKKEKK